MNTKTASPKNVQRGHGSAERPLTSVLWSRDSQDDNPVLTSQGNTEPDHRQVNYQRYYDPAWAAAEVEKVFSKSWLFACRDEDLPQVGDRVPYDVGPLSFFIIRSNTNEFKAFHNACIHRGTALCSRAAAGTSIRCPYHGWEWDLAGKLKRIPSHWDFTDVNRDNGSLREIKIGRWGGFIFINADPNATSLEDALLVLPQHFKEFAPDARYTAARFRKQVRANWKIAQEAFMESYHLLTTHPEAVPFSGDTQSQYDVWASEHGSVGRNASPGGQPSMHASPEVTASESAQMFAKALRDWHYPDFALPQLDPTADPRSQISEWHRKAIEHTYGFRPNLPDALLLDSILYFVFPHCAFWACESVPFTYQFTPHPTDPTQSYFEVRLLRPCPNEGSRPPAAPLIEIGADESVMEKAPAFSFLGYVFDQDMSNMPLIQKGVRAADPFSHHSRLGRYQEILIQHWNDRIDQMLVQ